MSQSEKVPAKGGTQETEMTRYSPLEGWMGSGFPTINRLFGDFWARRPLVENGLIAPAIDVSEDEGHIAISAELPGLKKEDVKIQFENGLLTISGEKSEESETKGRSFHCRERSYGAFHRSLTLPTSVNPDKAEAEFADGVLKIRLPLREEAKPKVVKIK